MRWKVFAIPSAFGCRNEKMKQFFLFPARGKSTRPAAPPNALLILSRGKFNGLINGYFVFLQDLYCLLHK
jgi:hypothetical protein